MTELGTDGKYPTGDYVLKFNGTGNLTVLGDARNLLFTEPNRLEFSVNQTTTNGLIIIITEPNVTGIDLREKIDEFSTETFGRNFTNAISPFEALRFSSWMIGRSFYFYNANANKNWSNRRLTSYFTQVGQNMVSIEYIVELGNKLEKDIWLSMPASADEDFITNLAIYVRDNFNSNKTVYVEQGSDKGFNANNRTLQMMVVRIWKAVFNSQRSRLKFVISTWLTAYFENVLAAYQEADLSEFDAFAVAGQIAYGVDFNSDSFNVSLSANYTTETIIDMIRQKIYQDEISLLFMAHKVALKFNKRLIGYNVGFLVHAPGFSNRWFNTSLAPLEQRLEDLIIESLRLPIVEDLMLDYFQRWYKVGAGIMFLRFVLNKI